MANVDKLRIEINGDPLSRGYSAMSDQQIAESLNSVDRVADRASLGSDEILNAFDATEFAELSAAQQSVAIGIAQLGQANPAVITRTLSGVFSGGSTTIAALSASGQERISRTVELSLGRVASGVVAEARRNG